MDGLGVCRAVGVKITLSAHKANGSALGGLVALPHERPLNTPYITVKNSPRLYFGTARIINKGVPRVIEARAWGNAAGDEKWKSVYW